MRQHNVPDVIVRRRKKKTIPEASRKPAPASPGGANRPAANPVAAPEPSNAHPGRLDAKYYDQELLAEQQAAKSHAATKPRPQGVVPPRREYRLIDGIEPFELFAAYHLGLTADGNHRPQNLHDLARRFGVAPERINEALKAYEIDSETVLNTDFDISMAEYDLRVAPEGVSRRELARQLYEDFRNSPRVSRDWESELAEDAAENARIFGQGGKPDKPR